jgi:hypothetical protein
MLWQTPSTLQKTLLALVIGLLLSLGMTVPAAQAQLSLQIDIEDATFDQGAILVTGTVTCSEPTDFTDISVRVRQPIGQRKSQEGDRFDSPGPCPGPQGLSFSILVAPFSGRYKGGTAYVFADTFGCNPNFCDGDADSQVFAIRK